MVNSLLFRWEDSQALQHHCGFCERPLSHPGARASCFGTHSEPCYRFHQAMFMRNRAHICNYCSAIDEAHYKRHHELVTQLRNIYEGCGETDWTVVPAEPGDSRDTTTNSLPPEETPVSKRDRKDAKCLVRAAGRARVVTQEEIRYVDSILHSAEGVSGGDGGSPANPEEMQLIEEHLRYNANVYNTQSSHRDLKKFAKIPDVDVDFEGEMERVLDTFRITELVKRNLRNRGLQGKELKNFEASVEVFKDAIVEDLVLVRKDMMEIRMRRAGYLRYTNKTAYSIVEDRYTEKDWKTGERITSSLSDSSGLTSLSEELTTPFEITSEVPLLPAPVVATVPDRRHLQHIHTRVNGEDGLGQEVIEPYHAPLLPLKPSTSLKQPPVLQLKVVENKENGIPAGMTNRGWLRRDLARKTSSGPFVSKPLNEISLPPSLPVIPVPVKRTGSTTTPAWDSVKPFTQDPLDEHLRKSEEDFPSLNPRVKASKSVWVKSTAPAVQPSTEVEKFGHQGPEHAVALDHEAKDTHPVVSQKKAKKVQREARRKAKKVGSSAETSNPAMGDKAGVETIERGICETSGIDLTTYHSHTTGKSMQEVSSEITVPLLRPSSDSGETCASSGVVAEQNTGPKVSLDSIAPVVPYTTHGKHEHWTRFARYFAVDQLTIPLLQTFVGCSHGSSCLFESYKVLDCPFHEPHCSCGDPLLNQCFLVHPSNKPCTSGPYNQAQGEKILAMYEQNDLTKGRLMLVDDDLVSYFAGFSHNPNTPNTEDIPPRLLREHTEFLDGYERGPLMKKELEYQRLFTKNAFIRHPLTPNMLQDIQHQNAGPKGSVKLCYCQTETLPNVRDIKKEFAKGYVVCSFRKCRFGRIFHKHCVKTLGADKVSRWYCTDCEKEMKAVADKVLSTPYKDGVAVVSDTEKPLAKKAVATIFANASAVTGRIKSYVQEFFSEEISGDLEVEDVD
ncbi:hypothetical protein OPT61_g5508 [Boeremia exigua]|uniref:Uncharacterized protein n=1 Tax=Boeremia exigua TaxID=749465 RepID=A0ACC2IA72_9PLEO|nr:hypothetical protein OPT61_g5508 [Boeremia exigua]